MINTNIYTFKINKQIKMKKSKISSSLTNLRRFSMPNILTNQKQHTIKQKLTQNVRIPSPVIKSIELYKNNDQLQKAESKKNDIKQIYEYKIKQQAKKSKQLLQKSKSISNSPPNPLTNVQDSTMISSLKMENQKMSRQLIEISKQNKRLKQSLSSTTNSNKIKTQKPKVQIKDYKKQMMKKLNDRQRLKTENVQTQNVQNKSSTYLLDRKDKQKSESSKNKIKSRSRNSITMNLNMSFVKLKSPSGGQNQIEFNPNMKNSSSNIFKSSSRKSLGQSLKSPQFKKVEENENIKSLLDHYMLKKSINSEQLQSFYSLNKKIFTQFNEFIVYSKRTYAQILSKINIGQCYNSKKMQSSSSNSKKNKKTQQILKLIQDLYKQNLPSHLKTQNNHDERRLNNSQEVQSEGTPSSSVVSFTELHNNPERQKSYEKYRLKKLNQNLDLLVKFQNKKLKTQITEAESNEPKVYFSKPVSTSVSRKISFNNSFNNSLKNSKICE